jgi:hypothetical protein
MKSVESVMEKLGIAKEEAKLLLNTAEEYSNKGKGLVFENHKTTEEIANLFLERPLWLSAELNEKVGWQFSQAVFWLRKRGWKIKTVSLGGHQFAYQLVEAGPQ